MKIRAIPDFEGIYGVTKDGKIWSYQRMVATKSRKGRIYMTPHGNRWLKTTSDKNGYQCLTFRKNRREQSFKVHRAVALVYLPNPLNLASVNHKNGIKTDNRVSNLEWCSMKYNRDHARVNKFYSQGETHANAKLSNEQIIKIRALAKTKTLEQKEIARRFNTTPAHISRIIRNKIRKNG